MPRLKVKHVSQNVHEPNGSRRLMAIMKGCGSTGSNNDNYNYKQITSVTDFHKIIPRSVKYLIQVCQGSSKKKSTVSQADIMFLKLNSFCISL